MARAGDSRVTPACMYHRRHINAQQHDRKCHNEERKALTQTARRQLASHERAKPQTDEADNEKDADERPGQGTSTTVPCKTGGTVECDDEQR
ncbi:MAG: hypothetical protein NVSMB42_15260 [Herpetosiphon sp.]